MRNCRICSFALLMILLVGWFLCGPIQISAEDLRNPSVGVIGRIEQIVLPGTELQVIPITNPDSPMIVRIADVFPHGDSWRYDLEFYGLEPGKYDLAEFLERIDGSLTSDLPSIDVEIATLLPPGQIEPNELKQLPTPWLGGYRILVGLAIFAWLCGLVAILFVGRKSKAAVAELARPKTLADYLKPRLEMALNGELDSRGYAELERMLNTYWKHRLNLDDVDPAIVLQKIKADKDAGPLAIQLEKWMHDPHSRINSDLGQLLEPYKSISYDSQVEFSNPGNDAFDKMRLKEANRQ